MSLVLLMENKEIQDVKFHRNSLVFVKGISKPLHCHFGCLGYLPG